MPKFTKKQRKTRRRVHRKAGLSISSFSSLGKMKTPTSRKKLAKSRYKDRFG